MDHLRVCPDCGGILEPTHPAWSVTIEFTAASDPAEPGPLRWQCLICGYQEDLARPSAHDVSPVTA